MALAMCRLAARADKSFDEELADRIELAESIAASRRAEDDAVIAEPSVRRLSPDLRRSKYRATGS